MQTIICNFPSDLSFKSQSITVWAEMQKEQNSAKLKKSWLTGNLKLTGRGEVFRVGHRIGGTLYICIYEFCSKVLLVYIVLHTKPNKNQESFLLFVIHFRSKSHNCSFVLHHLFAALSIHNEGCMCTYYLAESFNWYSLLREKHSWTPESCHSRFIAASRSSENGSVSCIRWQTSNTIFASLYK